MTASDSIQEAINYSLRIHHRQKQRKATSTMQDYQDRNTPAKEQSRFKTNKKNIHGKMAGPSHYASVIALSENRLNICVKQYKQAERILKTHLHPTNWNRKDVKRYSRPTEIENQQQQLYSYHRQTSGQKLLKETKNAIMCWLRDHSKTRCD